MQIHQKQDNDQLTIHIIGDLDASSSIQLDELLERAFEKKNYNIIVDFTDLNYISSAGVGVFISHLETIQAHQGNLTLINMKAHVYSVFEMLSLHKLINILNAENQSM